MTETTTQTTETEAKGDVLLATVPKNTTEELRVQRTVYNNIDLLDVRV